MTDAEKQQFGQRVEQELSRDGYSNKAVNKHLKRLNREIETELADVQYSLKVSKLPEYVVREKRIGIEQKKAIIQTVYNQKFGSPATPRQIELVKTLSDAAGTSSLKPVQKALAHFVALIGTLVPFLIGFILISIKLGYVPSLLAILGAVIVILAPIFIIISGAGGNFFFPIKKIYNFLFKVTFAFLGGNDEDYKK